MTDTSIENGLEDIVYVLHRYVLCNKKEHCFVQLLLSLTNNFLCACMNTTVIQYSYNMVGKFTNATSCFVMMKCVTVYGHSPPITFTTLLGYS